MPSPDPARSWPHPRLAKQLQRWLCRFRVTDRAAARHLCISPVTLRKILAVGPVSPRLANKVYRAMRTVPADRGNYNKHMPGKLAHMMKVERNDG